MNYKTKIALSVSKIAERVGLAGIVAKAFAKLPFDVEHDADHDYIVERLASSEREISSYSTEERILDNLLFGRDLLIAKKRMSFLDRKSSQAFQLSDQAHNLRDDHPLKGSYQQRNEQVGKIESLKWMYEQTKIPVMQSAPSRVQLYQFMKAQDELNSAINRYGDITYNMCRIAAYHGAT